uniref:Uncharacterized protein n=1 Tax=virus sp. ctBM815 TaxID=2825806 RepID=A0A8S5RKK1_9VIRU|nr:MAG TPA: hypothetical protein [virus sp. ctBM815]
MIDLWRFCQEMVILILMRITICWIRILMRVLDRHLYQRRNYTTTLSSIIRS